MANFIDNTVKGIYEEILNFMEEKMGTNNNPLLMRSSTGTLEALLSEENMVGGMSYLKGVQSPDGKFHRIKTVYTTRGLPDDVITDEADVECTQSASPYSGEDTFEIDQFISSPIGKFTEDEMRMLAKETRIGGAWSPSFSNWIGTNIYRRIGAAHTALNREILTSLNAGCIGVNVNNVVSGVPSAAAKSITLLDVDGNNLQDGWNNLRIDWSENHMSGPFFLIGQGNIQNFMYNNEYGCCNEKGVDFAKLSASMKGSASAFLLDQDTNSILGDNNILVMAPGVVQLAMANPFKGEFAHGFNGNFAHLTLPDPYLPIEWGLRINVVPCQSGSFGNVEYHLDLAARWALWCWPSDVFHADDSHNGVTGSFLYNVNREV